MDIGRIIKIVESFNGHIQTSLVKKGTYMTEKASGIAKAISQGKMVLDTRNGIETLRPDNHWTNAIAALQTFQATYGSDMLQLLLEDLENELPEKFPAFISQWEKQTELEDNIFDSTDPAKTASINVVNLLKLAEYIQSGS